MYVKHPDRFEYYLGYRISEHDDSTRTVSHGLNIAYELIQVRNGPICTGKPSSRGIVMAGTKDLVLKEMSDLWRTMRGEDGEKKREKTRRYREEIFESWRDGDARKCLWDFGEYLK